MTKRIKLSDRTLPSYTLSEERMNTITHALGGGFAIAALVLCVIKAACCRGPLQVTATAIYGGCMVALYCASSIYHAFRPCMA